MSLFNSIFGSSNEESSSSKINWRELNNLGQLNEIIEVSHQNPVLIFKHSTRCSISRMVLKQFENEFTLEDKITPYFLDLLNHRDISSEIASHFNVMHQSPQILIVKDGKSIFDESHEGIDASDLLQFTT